MIKIVFFAPYPQIFPDIRRAFDDRPDRDEFEYTITDKTGIHARPAGEIAGIAKKYDCSVTFEANGKSCSAASIVGLMSLGAAEGTRLTVRADGPEGRRALAALYDYMKENL